MPEVSETEITKMGKSEDNERVPIIRGNFEKLFCTPVDSDYVLVIIDAKNVNVYYIAKIIQVDDGNNYGVKWMT